MDKKVLRERMRKKQQQLRRRKMMKLGGYILAVILVVVFIVKGVILPITKGISGKDADKPVQVEADADKTAETKGTEDEPAAGERRRRGCTDASGNSLSYYKSF